LIVIKEPVDTRDLVRVKLAGIDKRWLLGELLKGVLFGFLGGGAEMLVEFLHPHRIFESQAVLVEVSFIFPCRLVIVQVLRIRDSTELDNKIKKKKN